MKPNDEQPRLAGSHETPRTDFSRLVGRVLAFAGGAVLLVAAFMFSLVAFAVLLCAGAVAFGYLWWKTRDLRRHLRERPPGGRVIEGEVIRDPAPREDTQRGGSGTV